MAVITISREFGSGGSDIAARTAQALGYHLADKETIATALSQYGVVEFETEYDTLPGFWARFDARRGERRDIMVSMVNRLILALAQHGNVVIVGRGSFAVLNGFGDVLNVRIQAPQPDRIMQVLKQQGNMTAEQAEAAVKEGDKVRAAFIESVYGVRWDDARAFDVVVDTSKIPPDLVTKWLVEAATTLQQETASGMRSTSAIQVDPVLASVVSEQFRCQLDHRG